MIIDCTSDLHGEYPKLAGGDLLIVGGDLTAKDTFSEYISWAKWVKKQGYEKVVWIAGNHEGCVEKKKYDPVPEYITDESGNSSTWIDYLCDSGTSFKGLKIWGSPWTLTFAGMSPKCKSFTVDTDKELAKKWAMIPTGTDILITHCPPWGLMDTVEDFFTGHMKNTGSKSLLEAVERIKPKIHVWGHIHEGYGQLLLKHDGPNTICVNASHVNENYKPTNKPIRVIL